MKEADLKLVEEIISGGLEPTLHDLFRAILAIMSLMQSQPGFDWEAAHADAERQLSGLSGEELPLTRAILEHFMR